MNRVSTRAAKNTMFDFVHLAVLCDTFISINAFPIFLTTGFQIPVSLILLVFPGYS